MQWEVTLSNQTEIKGCQRFFVLQPLKNVRLLMKPNAQKCVCLAIVITYNRFNERRKFRCIHR